MRRARYLPDGHIDVSLERGRRIVRWEPTDSAGRELHQAAGHTGGPHRFDTANDWERLALDIITITSGWTSTTIPSTLASASSPLGRQLREQFRNGEWTITAISIRDWLARHHHYTTTTTTNSNTSQ